MYRWSCSATTNTCQMHGKSTMTYITNDKSPSMYCTVTVSGKQCRLTDCTIVHTGQWHVYITQNDCVVFKPCLFSHTSWLCVYRYLNLLKIIHLFTYKRILQRNLSPFKTIASVHAFPRHRRSNVDKLHKDSFGNIYKLHILT